MNMNIGSLKQTLFENYDDGLISNADLGLHILNRAFEICEQNKTVQGLLFS